MFLFRNVINNCKYSYPLVQHYTNVMRHQTIGSPSQDLETEFRLVQKQINIHKFLQVGEVTKLLDCVESNCRISPEQALSLLCYCGRIIAFEDVQVRSELTKTTWKLLGTLGVPLDTRHFVSLLQAHIDNESKISTNEILQLMRKRQIQPDTEVYKNLIESLCQHGDVCEAKKMLQTMKEERLLPTKSILKSFIIGTEVEKGVAPGGVMETLNERNIPVDRDAYRSLIQSYSKLNKFPEAKATFTMSNKRSIKIDDKIICEAYVQFVIHKNNEAIQWLLPLLPINMPIHIAAPYVVRLTLAGEYDAASRIVDASDMVQQFHHHFMELLIKYAPTDVIVHHCHRLFMFMGYRNAYYNLLIKFGRAKNVTGALEGLKSMKNHLLPIPPSYLYHIIDHLDPLDITFIDDLNKILQFDDGTNSRLYSQHVLPLLDMRNPLHTFRHLHRHLPPKNKSQMGFLEYLLERDRLNDIIPFLMGCGRLKYYPLNLANLISKAFCSNLTTFHEITKIAAYIQKKLDGSDVVPLIIHDIDTHLRANAHQIDRQKIMTALITSMANSEVTLSKNDCDNLIRKCFCLSDDAEVALKSMVSTRLLSGGTEAALKPLRKQSRRQRIVGYCRRGSCEKVEELRKTSPIEYDSIMKVEMGTMYYNLKMYNEAVLIFRGLSFEKHSVDSFCIYIESLMCLGRLTHAIDVLEEWMGGQLPSQAFRRSLLQTFAALPNSVVASTLREKLYERKLLNLPDTELLKIFADIKRNKIDSALKRISENRLVASAMIHEAAYTHFTYTGRHDLLEQYNDFVVAGLGETKALHYLAYGFLYDKNFDDPTKIFKKLGSAVDLHFFRKLIVGEYLAENNLDALVHFMTITSKAPVEDRSTIFQEMILMCMERGSPKHVVELWNLVNLEGLSFDEDFTSDVKFFLKKS